MAAPPVGAAARAAEVVRMLASAPRPAGGEAEAAARAYCASRLRSAGFVVREEQFDYSAFVGRWGTPIAGAASLAILLGACLLGRRGAPLAALLLLALGGAVLGLAARWLGRDGVLSFPAQRRRGVNLVATRGPDVPTIWLMAHLDSKSQPVPILVRAAGITILGATWVVALVLSALQSGGAMGLGESAWWTVTVAAVIGAIPVIATTVGARSPGALDNATGVATVLAAAESSRAALGVCLTSAEELGLPGARAWVRGSSGHSGAVTLNVDSVDDTGAATCMYSGARPRALVAGVIAAAERARVPLRAHRLLPGVLTDGVALADAGWPVVTLSKGGVRTLARIHTPNDRAEHLNGTGMDEVTRVIVALLDSRT